MTTKPIPVILDTDIDTDCDDAGALAVLHALQSRGQATILGVVCSIPHACCAATVETINAAYGRPDIPIGLVRIPEWETSPRYEPYRRHRACEYCRPRLYNEIIAAQLAEPLRSRVFPDAVSLYRELLAGAPDGSVTICAIGTLSALAQLLDSTADSHSPFTGVELVRRKVRLLVSMAIADYPSGADSFNWKMDPVAAGRVLADWPTELIVSSPGNEILTGARFMAETPAGHPVHLAYRTHLRDSAANRPSWDQVAVIYAALGDSDLLAATSGLGLTFDPATGAHRWHAAAGVASRGYVQATAAPDDLARRIEDLMIEAQQRI
jgi:inosine-uridine nucleoside N-ribohydrolase